MKRPLLPIICAVLLVAFIALPLRAPGASAAPLSPHEKLLQQIEILVYEVSVLQSLVKNIDTWQPVDAAAYVAMRLSDNAILAEKNTRVPHSIASVTKLMTALVAREHAGAKSAITLTKEMLTPLGESQVLFVGAHISADNLLKAALSQSSNDAAEALAHTTERQKFIEAMNEKARDIGMRNTTFVDVHGLSPLNRSTAADLAALLRYIHTNHPNILSATKENNLWLPDAEGRLFKFRNVNNFYHLSAFIGGKTGYIPESRQTMASVFNVKGEPVAIFVLYSNNRIADIFSILNRIGGG